MHLLSSHLLDYTYERRSGPADDQVQVAFFLKHWTDIKKSETMTQIWQQIRLGKHVGFEEGML